jgi:hypothetical protein
MKKRKIEKKKSKNNNRTKIIVIIAVILLILGILFLGIKLTGQVTGQITGDATSSALYTCTDSDNGINYSERGTCKDRQNEYSDACYSPKGLAEYYCGKDQYACIMQESACPYGCIDGRCLKKNENIEEIFEEITNNTNNNVDNEVNNASEDISQKPTNDNSYFDRILIGLIIIILVIVVWRFLAKKLIKKKSFVNLSWK